MDRIGTWVAQEGILWSTEKGRAKVSQNVRAIRHAIETNLDMCEKALPILKDFLKVCGQKVWQDSDIEMLRQRSKKFTDDTMKLDYDRGSDAEMRSESMAYLKFRMNKIFNRADLKKDEDGEIAALIQDCSKDGKFGQTYDRLLKAYQDLQDEFKAIANKYGSNSLNQEILYGWAREYDFFAQQLMLTHSDTKVVTKGFKPSKVLEGYLDPQQRATLNAALEMAYAMEAEEAGMTELKASKDSKIKVLRTKVSSAATAFFNKLKMLFRRHKEDEEKPVEADATELFGFGNKAPKNDLYSIASGAADYIYKHMGEIEKGLADGDYLLYDGCDPLITDLAIAMKEGAWGVGIPLAMLSIRGRGKGANGKAPVVCLITTGNAKEVIAAGYCTVLLGSGMTLDRIREDLNAGKDVTVEASLMFYPLWDTQSMDQPIGPRNRVIPITNGTMEYTAK